MKNKTANQWLTYVISIITMIFSLNALAVSEMHEHLPLGEAKKLAQGETIKWRLHADKGKRKLQMLATIPQKCSNGANLISNQVLNKVNKDKWVITLDMPDCQTDVENFNSKITAKAEEIGNEPYFTHNSSNFSVEIDPNFQGKVQVCHLKSGVASEHVDDLRDRVICEDIAVNLSSDSSEKYLKDGNIISDKTIKAADEKLRKEKAEEERLANLGEIQDQAASHLSDYSVYCEERDLSGALNELDNLRELGLEFNVKKAKDATIETLLSDLDSIETLDELNKIARHLSRSKKEKLSNELIERAMQITLEEIKELAKKEVSTKKINKIIEKTDKAIKKMLGSRGYKKADVPAKIAKLYENAANILYKSKENKDHSIALLEKAKENVDSRRGELKISGIQANIYVNLYKKCIGKAKKSKDFNRSATKCTKRYGNKGSNAWDEYGELAVEVLDNEENEEDTELLQDILARKDELLGHPQFGVQGEIHQMTWQAYTEWMQIQQAKMQQSGNIYQQGPGRRAIGPAGTRNIYQNRYHRGPARRTTGVAGMRRR